MKFLLCLIASFFAFQAVTAQNSSASASQLKELVKEYDNLFLYTKSVVDSLTKPVEVGNHLLGSLVDDSKIGEAKLFRTNSAGVEIRSTTDFGIKWVSDATYNFTPGIGESEDVFFRSRVSTGIDWAILGEGSLQRSNQSRRTFEKQLRRDSVQLQINSNSFLVHHKQLFLKYIFDLHRLNILKNYLQVLQMHAAYQGNMNLAGLSNNIEVLKINNKVQAVTDVIEVYQSYLSENIPDDLVQQYWNIPYIQLALPNMSEISMEQLLKREELLVQMQKDLLISNHKPSEKPSLRAKFRYNYYDNADQIGRSFASVGASLTVPISFGKDDQKVAYQMASYDNNLYFEKLKLKEKLSQQHKTFHLLKSKLMQLQNDVSYTEALLKNEVDVYLQQSKNFSPAKYIEYAEMLFQKKLVVLDVKEQLCEEYVSFQLLSGANDSMPEIAF